MGSLALTFGSPEQLHGTDKGTWQNRRKGRGAVSSLKLKKLKFLQQSFSEPPKSTSCQEWQTVQPTIDSIFRPMSLLVIKALL